MGAGQVKPRGVEDVLKEINSRMLDSEGFDLATMLTPAVHQAYSEGMLAACDDVAKMIGDHAFIARDDVLRYVMATRRMVAGERRKAKKEADRCKR